MWTNYHCHTNFCDGKKSVAEVVQAAKEQGLLAIGLSSHAPLPFETKWAMKATAFEKYREEIAAAKEQIPGLQVYTGLEVDFIPGKISPFTFKDKLDYTVGSVHFVDQFPDGNGWEIDNTFEVFMKGLTAIFNGNIQDAVKRYYQLTREMISNTPPNIVGHMDKIKMHNRGDHFFKEQESWYQEELDRTLVAIKKAGCIVEVNTRGLYQNKTDTTYPSPWILREIASKDIPVTISSDAHHPDDLTNRFPEVVAQLKEIGFKKLRILLDGRWTDVTFDHNGIIHPKGSIRDNKMA
ncbi:MAG TPA: histidinol-phosphatase [Cyclobacteriaceae bacterium]|nr:histidinol-phosphatase [Cyclobacteriaceae bacterium]